MFSRLLLLALPLIPTAALANDIEARLLSDVDHVSAGQPFWVGVELTMASEWHTYYVNPGDAGIGTTVNWQLPDGWSVDSLQWPIPKTFGEPPEVMYGYEGVVLLTARVTPPKTITPQSTSIGATVSWLGCREICIPGKADLSLTLPVGNDSGESGGRTEAGMQIQSALDLLPIPPPAGVSIQAVRTDGQLSLLIRGIESRDIYFFSSREDVIDHSAEQKVADAPGGDKRLILSISQYATEPARRLSGILVAGTGADRKGYMVDVDVQSR